MKRIITLGLIGLMAVSMIGCQPATVKSDGLDEPAVSQVRDNVEVINFEEVMLDSIKDEGILKEIEAKMYEEGHLLFYYEGSQYIAVFAGERSSGGYSLSMDAITKENDTIYVFAFENRPGPDDMVTMALTYPMTIAKLNNFEINDNHDIAVGIVTDEDEGPTDYFVSPTDDIAVGEWITIGEIVQFDGNYVHIISGDLIQVYDFDGKSGDFYLGQLVQLTKGEENNYLEKYEKDDYTITHTNMGHMIDQFSGELIEVKEDMITVETKDGKVDLKTFEPMNAVEGSQVTAYVVNFSNQEPSVLFMLNEESKLKLTINTIERGPDGAMILYLKDENAGEYTMNISGVMVEFDITELSVGDDLTVYHDGIMESWPMQLNTILVRK